jgi:hypothetical protein
MSKPATTGLRGAVFNGLPLKKIAALKTVDVTPGVVRITFRVLGGPLTELEQRLHLNVPVLLILPSEEIRGRIVDYAANIHSGYEITIESQKSG